MKRLILLVALCLVVSGVSAVTQFNLTNTTTGNNIVIFNGTAGTWTWQAPAGVTSVQVMVVGGGGGGGSNIGGGGGAGGVNYSASYTVTPLSTYTIIVGSGGSTETSGGNSSFGISTTNISAMGGGRGGHGGTCTAGVSGGSGGGGGSGIDSATSCAGGSGILGQGFRGGNVTHTGNDAGGGGGGNSSIGGDVPSGVNPGNGGTGYVSVISKYAANYSCGGGGGDYTGTHATGGCPEAGLGGFNSGGAGGSATVNTGSGGGGGAFANGNGGSGASGIVILQYSGVGSISASFTQVPNPSSVGQAVTFTDTSTGTPVTWNWTMYKGGGSPDTFTTQNVAAYTYSAYGSFVVLFNVTNATGYWSNTSATHTVVNASGFAPQDVWQQQQLLQRFSIVDGNTGLPIAVANLQDQQLQTYATTNGTGFLTEPFGSNYIVFSSVGYTSRGISYYFDSPQNWTVQLYQSTTTQPYAVTYPPKDTRFHLQTIWGLALPGANVTATASQTTLGNYSYVASLYGYSLNTVPLNTLTLSGKTDTKGDITFAMMADVQYAMTYSLAGYAFPTGTTITPHDDNYIIYANSVGNTLTVNGTAPQASVVYSVQENRINQTAAQIFVNYTDVAGATTGGFLSIYRTNSTLGNNTPPIEFVNVTFSRNLTQTNYTFYDGTTTSCPASNSTVYNGVGSSIGCFNVTLVNGQSCTAKTTGYTPVGNVYVQDPVWFRNIASPIAGLSPEFALFMALGIMMFTAMMAGISTAPPISLAVTFEGWIFWGMNMFNIIDIDTYSGASPVVLVLSVMTFISFLYLFVTYRRSGK